MPTFESVNLIIISLIGVGMVTLGLQHRRDGGAHLAAFGAAMICGSARRYCASLLSGSVNYGWAVAELLLAGLAVVLYVRERRRAQISVHRAAGLRHPAE